MSSTIDIIGQVRELLRTQKAAVEGEDFLDFQIVQATQPALRQLGHEIADDEERRILLRRDFTTNALDASGVVDISALLTGTEPLIFNAIKDAEIYHLSNPFPLQWVTDRATLDNAILPDEFLYFTLAGNKLRTASFQEITPVVLTGTLSGSANCVPDLSRINSDLEKRLVELVALLIRGGK